MVFFLVYIDIYVPNFIEICDVEAKNVLKLCWFDMEWPNHKPECAEHSACIKAPHACKCKAVNMLKVSVCSLFVSSGSDVILEFIHHFYYLIKILIIKNPAFFIQFVPVCLKFFHEKNQWMDGLIQWPKFVAWLFTITF